MKEIRVLNRVLRWTAQGIAYEADPRHAEILMTGLLGASRPVTTPGTAAAKGGLEEEEREAEAAPPAPTTWPWTALSSRIPRRSSAGG